MYEIIVKPSSGSSYAPPAWLVAVKEIDPAADVAQVGQDAAGNIVYEIDSNGDLESVRQVSGVVSIERQ